MSNRKRVKCPVCKRYTYMVCWSKSHSNNLIGRYCKHCKTLYPIKGVKIGTDALYQGLKRVSQ